MSIKPEEYVVDAWIALLRAKEHSLNFVEKSFKENGLPPFFWYDVLWELDKAGEKGLRPFEIEQGMLLPQYGLSRLLARMEKADYVERVPSPNDGRGHQVIITKLGKEVRQDMWKVYAKGIQSTIGENFNEDECRTIQTLLTRLYRR
ncbi:MULTISPECIES: MarR family winged helix-turn-helix transcriptional regulator [Pseudoalteromonas]|uniref:Helix-turn-helix domain-containing protein n=1 Tax=Pseudoalteromonas obscura TaxID=3048491 RepID=A0ABT7EN13_9GAMM|nr:MULTISPECIES: helix-turn-helix domain-containing protein [Pseudoalteromonas]MBQ4838705.1 MarR family transcriptional regulator [Pseudoalteromonas luteoviolacea]MDK2596429.1 helix-turn-helix domain-containing protein [Pseudoalteromonas sp. P94(2023)]